jgi:hypothetical protein
MTTFTEILATDNPISVGDTWETSDASCTVTVKSTAQWRYSTPDYAGNVPSSKLSSQTNVQLTLTSACQLILSSNETSDIWHSPVVSGHTCNFAKLTHEQDAGDKRVIRISIYDTNNTVVWSSTYP